VQDHVLVSNHVIQRAAQQVEYFLAVWMFVQRITLPRRNFDYSDGLRGARIEFRIHHPANPTPGVFDLFYGLEVLN
jgi:hypothetical protein